MRVAMRQKTVMKMLRICRKNASALIKTPDNRKKKIAQRESKNQENRQKRHIGSRVFTWRGGKLKQGNIVYIICGFFYAAGGGGKQGEGVTQKQRAAISQKHRRFVFIVG